MSSLCVCMHAPAEQAVITGNFISVDHLQEVDGADMNFMTANLLIIWFYVNSQQPSNTNCMCDIFPYANCHQWTEEEQLISLCKKVQE